MDDGEAGRVRRVSAAPQSAYPGTAMWTRAAATRIRRGNHHQRTCWFRNTSPQNPPFRKTLPPHTGAIASRTHRAARQISCKTFGRQEGDVRAADRNHDGHESRSDGTPTQMAARPALFPD